MLNSYIAYTNSCIPTLRVTSRSGSRFIQYERHLIRVQRLAREGLEAASCQTEPGEKNRDEPQRPCPTPLGSRQGRLNLFSFDSNPKPNPQNLHRGEAIGPPEPIEWLGHLLGGGLRSSECHMRALPTLSANDGPRFHMNIPVSELIEHDTRAIEVSVVDSAPPIVETKDGVMCENTAGPYQTLKGSGA